MKECWVDLRSAGDIKDAVRTEAIHHGVQAIVAADVSDLETLPPTVVKVLMPGQNDLPEDLDGVDIVTLGAEDVSAMMELTALTKPGPFSARTHELGTFLGIRVGGNLVAMAGERMKPAGYTEITAVCVHPSHRGRGYGQMLLGAVSRQILARGEIPFLHVFSSKRYKRQGMEIRRSLHVTVLQKA